MNPQAGPFAYIDSENLLARTLGVSLASLAIAKSAIANGHGYDYRTVWIHGKERALAVPREHVKDIQRRVAEFLWPLSGQLDDACVGYVPGGSTVRNASRHCGQRWIQRLDIKDFYPSTEWSKVNDALQRWGANPEVARTISDLTTDRGKLPMGAPSSPLLSNLVLSRLDPVLASECRDLRVAYTRYADDLTFSSMERFDMTAPVSSALEEIGYELNEAKSRLRQRGQRIVVTGLTVAEPDFPRLPKQVKRRLRQELHYIERFGLEEHCSRRYLWPFIDEDDEERQVEHSRRHLEGKLRYALGVEPEWTRQLLRDHPRAKSELMPQANPRRRRDALVRLAQEIRAEPPLALSDKVSVPLGRSSSRIVRAKR